jgi:hypothetical protein
MALRPLPVALVLTLAFVLAGCSQPDEDDGGSGASGTGSASAYVKDAPSDDFREVHVVFTEAKLHRSGSGDETGSTGVGTATATSTAVGNTTLSASVSVTSAPNSTTTTSSDAGSQAGWIVLFSDAAGVDVDLLNTTGARAAFLGEEDLEAGHYQQIRIVVKEAYGITRDGERKEITVSSGELRSVRSFTVEADQETRITIDIDLEKSLKQSGNGQWRLSPVIGKTTAEVVDDESSGEDTAQPGDVESVPEAGDGSTASGSATASASVSTTLTGTSTATGTSTGP